MSLKPVFYDIDPDDRVYVQYGHREYETDVELISGKGSGRRVNLSLNQDQPTLVIEHDRVLMELRPLGYPREWSAYEEVSELDIIS